MEKEQFENPGNFRDTSTTCNVKTVFRSWFGPGDGKRAFLKQLGKLNTDGVSDGSEEMPLTLLRVIMVWCFHLFQRLYLLERAHSRFYRWNVKSLVMFLKCSKNSVMVDIRSRKGSRSVTAEDEWQSFKHGVHSTFLFPFMFILKILQ